MGHYDSAYDKMEEEEKWGQLYALQKLREDTQCTLRHAQAIARQHSQIPELQLAEQNLRTAVSLILACEVATRYALDNTD